MNVKEIIIEIRRINDLKNGKNTEIQKFTKKLERMSLIRTDLHRICRRLRGGRGRERCVKGSRAELLREIVSYLKEENITSTGDEKDTVSVHSKVIYFLAAI